MEKTQQLSRLELLKLGNQVSDLSTKLAMIAKKETVKVKINQYASIIVSEDTAKVFDLAALALDKTLEIIERFEQIIDAELKECADNGKIKS